MLLIRNKTPRNVGRVRMINIAAFDQPDEVFMIRVLDPKTMAGTAGIARYRPEFDAVVERVN
jgi:hypothetical protein